MLSVRPYYPDKSDEKDKILNIRITPGMFWTLKTLCKQLDRNRSDVARAAIQCMIDHMKVELQKNNVHVSYD